MKLNELTGIKNIHKSYSDLLKYIKELGFKFIGKGAYGRTYQGKNSVLKIFKNDLAYEKYVKFTKTIPDQYKKFVPKITSVRRYPYDYKIKFVKIELLNKLDNDQKNIVNYTNEIFISIFNVNKNYIFENINTEQKIISLISKNQKILKRFLEIKDFIDFEFLIFLFYLKSKFKDRAWDINESNVMSRNIQLVVTDPIA
jgi:hypothetical protein